MDPVVLAARGESVWHRLGLQALGVDWLEDGQVARRTAVVTPVFLAALSLAPEVPAARLAAGVDGLPMEATVRDTSGTGDLAPFGFMLQAREPWMLRDPGPVGPLHAPDGLVVRACQTPDDVELFERTSVEAFTGGAAGWEPGTIHPPATSLRVPGLTLLLARLDGEPVGTAIAARDGTVTNVGGVAVVESARRRGIGAQLTAAALSVAATLPAVLTSSEDGHDLYLRLGFRDVGTGALWWRPAPR